MASVECSASTDSTDWNGTDLDFLENVLAIAVLRTAFVIAVLRTVFVIAVLRNNVLGILLGLPRLVLSW